MKDRFKSTLVGVCCLFLSLVINAQEQIGFHTDNYSGINAIRLNPTAYTQSPYGWDINLGAAGIFMGNNYAFIRPTSLIDLIQNGENANYLFAPDLEGKIELGTNDYLVDFKNDGKKRYLFHNAQIQGPSFFVKINDQNYIGLHTAMRTASSASGITESLSYYTYDATPFFQDIAIDKFNLGFLSWGEVGLNYSFKTQVDNGNLAIGATIKKLTGLEAGYLYSDKDWSLQKLPGDSIASNNATLYFGYTNSNLDINDIVPANNGQGWGIDLGATYTIGSYEDGYDWKFGVSLLDIGKINFKDNAKSHIVKVGNLVAVNGLDYEPYQDLNQLEDIVGQFSQDVLNDPTASLTGEQFNMWLPGAVSLQAERAITPAVYVNATWLQGLPIAKPGVRRGSLLAITPRLEKKWYGLAFPISLYNYQQLRTGFALRLAFLTIGSDHLGSLVNKAEFSGTDFYMAIKLNPFGLQGLFKGNGGHKAHRTKRRGHGKGVKCYQF